MSIFYKVLGRIVPRKALYYALLNVVDALEREGHETISMATILLHCSK